MVKWCGGETEGSLWLLGRREIWGAGGTVAYSWGPLCLLTFLIAFVTPVIYFDVIACKCHSNLHTYLRLSGT